MRPGDGFSFSSFISFILKIHFMGAPKGVRDKNITIFFFCSVSCRRYRDY